MSDIAKPAHAERCRSDAGIGVGSGVGRVDLERSKTDMSVNYSDTTGENGSELDHGSGMKPNTERALMAQAVASSSTKLMSLSLGRGQGAAVLSAAHIDHLQWDGPPQLVGKVDSTEESTATTDSIEYPSIESYIGKTFPRVKNHLSGTALHDGCVDEASVGGGTGPREVSSPSTSTSGISADQVHGKKSSRLRKGPNKVEAANIIAIASEITRPLQLTEVPLSRAILTTPPRKIGNLDPGSSSSRSGSPMIDTDRSERGHSVSRGNGQARLVDSTRSATGDARAVGNDRLLQQRLQEAKALNRKEKDTNGGAVMHKFSLWQGVEKRAPLIDHMGAGTTEGGGGAGVVGIAEMDKLIRKQSSDSVGARENTDQGQCATSAKRPTRFVRGSHGARSVQEEAVAMEPLGAPGPLRLAKLTPQRSSPQASIQSNMRRKRPPSNTHNTPQRSDKSNGHTSVRSKIDFEVASDGSLGEVSSDDDSAHAMVTASGGRASAFRNMVGICKLHNSSAGSVAESVQTEYGPNMWVATATSNSIDSVYSDDDFENAGDDHDAVILGIAIDDCSILSEEDQVSDGGVDQASTMEDDMMIPIDMTREKLKNHVMSPESSHSSLALSQSNEANVTVISSCRNRRDLTVDSMESVEHVTRIPTFSPVVELSADEPPPLRKGHDKAIGLFPRDPSPAMKNSSSNDDIYSTVSSTAHTESRGHSDDRGAGGTSVTKGHVSKKIYVTGKDSPAASRSGLTNRRGHKTHRRHKPARHTDALNTSTRSDDGGEGREPSPTLSEASGIESDHEVMKPFNIATLSKTAPPSVMATHDELEEVYTLQGFEWKKGTEILGEGTFGRVYKGMACSTGELLAVKQICLTDGTEEEVTTLRREIDLMQGLVHPNIVR